MASAPRLSRSLLADIAIWLVTLAVLALIAELTSGALAAALSLLALAGWIATIGRFRGSTFDRAKRPRHERRVSLLVTLAPALVGLVVADAVAGADWYAFIALAIAFPLMLVWRNMVERWYARGRRQPAA